MSAMPGFVYDLLGFLNNTRALVHALTDPVDFGVHAIAEQHGKIVLIRQSFSRGWRFPGGGVGHREPGPQAALRELREEIGLVGSGEPVLFGLYARPIPLGTNLIALYRIPDAVFAFKPSLEIKDLLLADPAAPPPDTIAPVRRRLQELQGKIPRDWAW